MVRGDDGVPRGGGGRTGEGRWQLSGLPVDERRVRGIASTERREWDHPICHHPRQDDDDVDDEGSSSSVSVVVVVRVDPTAFVLAGEGHEGRGRYYRIDANNPTR